MKPRFLFFFWLGSLDSRVAAGSTDVGGTHDIRFCSVAQLVERFVGNKSDSNGRWQIKLEAYPEAGLDEYNLTIVEYYGQRCGECAMPSQYAGTGREYRLWKKIVRPFGGRPFRIGTRPKEAIVLIRDDENKFHARMLRREQVKSMPDFFRDQLEEFDECGRLIEVSHDWEWTDFPIGQVIADKEIFILEETADKEVLITKIKSMPGATGKRLSIVERHNRSRRLAEFLKRLYEYNCQICDGSIPRIHMGGNRYYVEVHHINGFSEIDHAGGHVGITQEESALKLDSAENLVVVCPYHHMFLHYGHGGFKFNRREKCFIGNDGTRLELRRNDHL